MRRLLAMIILTAGAASRLAWGVEVPIVNPGFEQVVLPCAPAPTCFARTASGWTGSGIFSTFKPSTGAGGIYPGGLPEGVNVGSLGDPSGDGSLVQTLTAALQPSTTYTLVFSVGSRADFLFSGYTVELLAGSLVLASDSSLAPPAGTFVTGRIVYSSNANPTLVGQKLGIRLTNSGRGQSAFDKLSLDATPTVVSSATCQIASGGGWKTALTLVNLMPAQNSVTVTFRNDDGLPLFLPLISSQDGTSPQVATASSLERTIEPGATLLIESEASAPGATLVGWAEVRSSGPVGGFAIFRRRDQGGRDSEGTTPLESSTSSSLLLPFDNTSGFSTGAALVNLTGDAVIISARIRDAGGAQVGLQAVALSPYGHSSFDVADRFSATRGRRGTIEFQNSAGGPVTGLGLRFSPSGSFTSVPIVRP